MPDPGKCEQAILKAQQNVQGGPEHWMPEVELEAGDAFIALCGVAHRAGFDLAEAVAKRWATVSQRDYRGTGS